MKLEIYFGVHTGLSHVHGSQVSWLNRPGRIQWLRFAVIMEDGVPSGVRLHLYNSTALLLEPTRQAIKRLKNPFVKMTRLLHDVRFK